MKVIYHKAKKILVLMTGIILLMSSMPGGQLHAQYIPIDSNFAQLLTACGMGGCVSNNQLDTICAKADSSNTIFLRPTGTYQYSTALTNLEGLQYFSGRGPGGALKYLIIHDLGSLISMPAHMPDVYSDFELKYCPVFTTLPVFGNSLTSLSCDQTNITAVTSPLPSALQMLAVEDCPLSTLPALPATLMELFLDHDQFTSLPPLPAPIFYLSVNNNQLASLPTLPSNLRLLILSNNNLTSVPRLPDGVQTAMLANNFITQLPALPHHLMDLSVNNNPGMTCLPWLPDSVTSLDVNWTAVTCVPNIPAGLNTLLPVCNDTDVSCPYGGVSGYIYWDRDSGCTRNAGDMAMPRAIVSIDNGLRFTMTDSRGFYRIALDSGNHSLQPIYDTILFIDVCNPIYNIFYNGWDTLRNINFPLQTHMLCTNMSVDVASSSQKLCSGGNSYGINYVNKGTDTAYNVMLQVKFPTEIVIQYISQTPDSITAGNIYHFTIGTVPPFGYGGISVLDSTLCTGVLGQAVCVKARISPRNSCLPVSALWDSSDVEVASRYAAPIDTVIFTILNVGHNMTGPVAYRLYEDELLQQTGHVQLNAHDSLIIRVQANGHTYRVEADQRPYHPGNSRPREFMELAGGPLRVVGYVASVPQDDADEWVEIDCHVLSNSHDPNEKEVYPSGIGPNHYVTAGDNLTYIIGFQNNGNDTASTVVVIDTLDAQHLDPATFESGVSSHHYDVSMSGRGVVKWTFNNIRLVDSANNPRLSQGFVKFKIAQRAGNLPGTRINNFADIYFDQNTAVRTATCFVTIQTADVIFPSSVKDITAEPGYSINAYPNPFDEYVRFVITADIKSNEPYHFEMTDIMGNRVMERNVNATFDIERNTMATGIYLYRITRGGEEIGKGKILAR